jgi:hypothetical protein
VTREYVSPHPKLPTIAKVVEPRERGILMSAPMVRALLRDENPKTQTRRVVKPQPHDRAGSSGEMWWEPEWFDDHGAFVSSPLASVRQVWDPRRFYGVPGDQLWVRETWAIGVSTGNSWHTENGPIHQMVDPQRYPRRYAADGTDGVYGKWRPGIHMYRWASRITLEITDVRVQRLQDISEEDAKAEGIYPEPHPEGGDRQVWTTGGVWAADDPVSAYLHLWEDINNPKGWCPDDNPMCWGANPWVWALTFKRLAP